ncbi:MAG TPA: hypothetical protein PKD78_11165, partial [Saprospiraceae bacterium]|nr:hypothetical protein [Saprospiraceae bacterium]
DPKIHYPKFNELLVQNTTFLRPFLTEMRAGQVFLTPKAGCPPPPHTAPVHTGRPRRLLIHPSDFPHP